MHMHMYFGDFVTEC